MNELELRQNSNKIRISIILCIREVLSVVLTFGLTIVLTAVKSGTHIKTRFN